MKENQHEGTFQNIGYGARYLDSVSPSTVLQKCKEANLSEIYVAKPISLARSEPLYQPDRDSADSRLSEPRGMSKL